MIDINSIPQGINQNEIEYWINVSPIGNNHALKDFFALSDITDLVALSCTLSFKLDISSKFQDRPFFNKIIDSLKYSTIIIKSKVLLTSLIKSFKTEGFGFPNWLGFIPKSNSIPLYK